MSRFPIYQVDAFAAAVFHGNPAAVCPLPAWPDDRTLQSVAEENRLSETAFFLTDRDPTPLRWYTPTQEVPLCGHATLAAGFVLLTSIAPEREAATFSTASGPLTVSRDGDALSMDFPRVAMERVEEIPSPLEEGLGRTVEELWRTPEDPNYLVILERESDVARLRPNLALLERFHPFGIAVSAPGDSTDFVSRYFAPGYGIPEDPVTGSIHCALGPYWSARLGDDRLEAVQLSERSGRLGIAVEDDRVRLSGRAACYLVGEASFSPEGLRPADVPVAG